MGRIQGIIVEIGDDTTKLKTALKGVNAQRKRVRDTETILSADPLGTGLWCHI